MKKKTIFASGFIAIWLCTAVSLAGTVHYGLTSDGTIHHYEKPGWIDLNGWPAVTTDTLASANGQGTPMPNLTANFTIDKIWQISFSAPEGMRFTYTPPSPNFANMFEIFLSNSHEGLPPAYNLAGVTLEWQGVSGHAPTTLASYSTFAAEGDSKFMVSLAAEYLTESFSFTGFTVTLAMPDEFNANFNELPLTFADIGFYSAGPFNVESLVQLEAIPEPTSPFLLAIATILWFFNGRKSISRQW